MKASEITQPGMYWMRRVGAWYVVPVADYDSTGELLFNFGPITRALRAEEMHGDFEFIGPLPPQLTP